jgi:DNA-directed RNA polymerase subunit K/omega
MESPKTLPVMTKYELAALLGTRMEQLALGAPSTLPKEELEKLHNVQDIAKEELRTKRIPLVVTRSLPNTSLEDWNANDLACVNSSLI